MWSWWGLCPALSSLGLVFFFRHQQYKRISSCVSQCCGGLLHCFLSVFCKALLLASEFPTFYERFFMVCANSSSSGSMKKIPRNYLALSSFGSSIAHLCFAFFFAASDTCSHISGHIVGSGSHLFPRLSPLDHVYPSGAFRSKNESCETCPCIW